jgi:TusA-related sulfurtransferase
MPIIETTDKMRELEIGQVLEVLADDKGIKTDMPAWCESTGNEFLGMEEEEDGEYKVYVRKLVET